MRLIVSLIIAISMKDALTSFCIAITSTLIVFLIMSTTRNHHTNEKQGKELRKTIVFLQLKLKLFGPFS